MITCPFILNRDQGLVSFQMIRYKRKAQVCQSWLVTAKEKLVGPAA